MAAFGLLGCAMASFVPLGCSARIIHSAVQEARPRVPDATASRLQECVDEFSGDLAKRRTGGATRSNAKHCEDGEQGLVLSASSTMVE